MSSHETIHSGHFMVSNVHDKCYDDEEEIDVVSDGRLPVIDVTPDTKEKDEQRVTFYKFGPQTTRSIDIDTSLLKLNRCIQTAYAQLITPKWKFFKGLKLAWKERIRLNNVIWRAWHAQFVRNVPPKFCFFSVPEDDWHGGTEAAGVMEGIYWKRRMETVCAQYKRWRHFYIRRTVKTGGGRRIRSRSFRHSNSDEDALLLPLPSLTPLSGFDDDDWNNWFTDTLFSSLSQPYLFPNPKEMAQAGNADFIQPGLVQLQPSLEEIMASLENDGPLSGCSDPSLSIGASNQEMDRMNDPMSEEASMESLRTSASHYTSKDYAAASLLVEYSNSGAGQSGASPAECSNDFGMQQGKSASGQAPMQGYNFRPMGPSCGCDGQIYSPISPRDPNNAASLCDPYVPQVATIETNSVQYTLAKTWLAENNGNNGRSTTATAGRYDYTADHMSSAANSAYSQMPATIQLLKSDPCVLLPASSTPSGKDYDMAGTSGSSVTTKRGRQATRRPPEKRPQRTNKCTDMPAPSSNIGSSSLASRTPTIGIMGSGSNDQTQSLLDVPPPVPNRRRGSAMVPPKSASGSSRRRASSSFTEIRQPGQMGLAPVDYIQFSTGDFKLDPATTTAGIDETQGERYSSLQPLLIQQQMGVVRPIPISLAARADSAFSAVSPTGFSPAPNAAHSPLQQRSPGGSNAAPIDYSKALVCANDAAPAMGNVCQPQLLYGAPSGPMSSQTQSSTQTPVLILQPFGGMQIPIMALPYSNSGASFTAAPMKQEVDKVPLSPYDPDSYASFGSDVSMKDSSQRGIAQQPMPIPRSVANQRSNQRVQESAVMPLAKKTAKRPADSTLDPSERKRVQHLHAEQSRRSALKGGFELLEDLLPEFNSTNTKPTNALVLLKSAERIRELKNALPNNDTTVLRLKTEIQQMNEKIGNYQKQMAVSGKSVSKVGMFQQMIENYIKQRSQQYWQFWLMKKVLDPLLETYKTDVQGSCREELVQSAIQWARKRCTKEEIRPVVNNFLVQLGVETPILKDPGSFRQYVLEQMDK